MDLPLVGLRLRVRPWAPDEVQAVFDLLGSPLTMGEMRAGRVDTVTEAKTWLGRRLQQHAEDGLTMWAVELLDDGAVVGACGVFPQGGDLELAYIVDHRHRGHGYAREAASLVLSALEASGDSHRVYATIRPVNTASRRVAEGLLLRMVEERQDDHGALLVYRL